MRSLIAGLACLAMLLLPLAGENTCQANGRGHFAPIHQHGAYVPQAGHVYLVPVPASGGYAVPSAKRTYAYGWFGVKPRRHKSVHHGYYNHRTDWSCR